MTVVNHLDVVLISEVQSPAEEKMEEITPERYTAKNKGARRNRKGYFCCSAVEKNRNHVSIINFLVEYFII